MFLWRTVDRCARLAERYSLGNRLLIVPDAPTHLRRPELEGSQIAFLYPGRGIGRLLYLWRYRQINCVAPMRAVS